MVKTAIEEMDREVTNAEIRDFIRNRFGSVNPDTINAHILLQAVNVPSRINWPENQRPRISDDARYDVLYRVRHGRYVKYQPHLHGVWEIKMSRKGKPKVSRMSIGPAGERPDETYIPDFQDDAVFSKLEKYNWSRLNHLQLGKYAEYFVKMELTLYGFEVYTSEVDDRGIDFVARSPRGKLYEVQVKSVRGLNYIFFPKDKFRLHSNLIAAVVIFHSYKQPEHYLIRSTKWEEPDALLRSHDYIGKKSPPEWGLNISQKNLPLLERFRFDRIVKYL
jgi:hypothetical protein